MKKKSSRCKQLERMYRHGRNMTVYVYPGFRKANSRSKKYRATSEVQKKLNDRYAQEKFCMTIDANFTSTDIEAQFSFLDKFLPETYEECLVYIQKYLRRVRNYFKKEFGAKLKYVGVIEKGARRGRFHAHITMNIPDPKHRGEIREQIEKLWEYGNAVTFPLVFNEEGMSGMSKYLVRNPEKPQVEGMYKSWIQSRGLKKPVRKDRTGYISKQTVQDIREGSVTERELERLYPGYTITSMEATKNNINQGEYLVIKLYKRERS